MSTTLVKKALALFDKQDSGKKYMRRRKGVKTPNVQKSNKVTKPPSSYYRNTLKNQKVKSAIEKYKTSQPTDQTDLNLKILQVLSKKKTEAAIVKKILMKASKPEVQGDVDVVEKDISTVFTEEDFAWFEKNYKIK